MLVLASFAVSAPAHATFTGIGPISDQQAVTPVVAMDEDGTAIFAWNAFYFPTTDCGTFFCFRIEARAQPKSGAIGAIETISDPTRNAQDPDVAVDDDGNAVFVWVARNQTGNTIEARRRSAAGVLGPIEVLSDPGEDSFVPQVVVSDNGKAVFAWQAVDGTTNCGGGNCSTIQTRTLSAGGALNPIQKLSDPARFARLPQLGVDDEGDSVFVWVVSELSDACGSCTRVQARARSAAGALKPIQTLSSAGKAGPGQIAVDDDGNAVFAWDRLDGSDDCGGGECSRIQTRRLSASGSLSSTQTLSSAGQDAVAPQVAVDGAGKATFVWSRGDGTDDCEESACFRVQTRTRTSGGTLGSTKGLSHSGSSAQVPQLAVDERSNAVFVWERIDTTVDCGDGKCSQVQVRSRTPGGTLTGTKTLSDLGPNAAPVVAVDPDGGADSTRAAAAVDWIGPGERIEAALQKGDS